MRLDGHIQGAPKLATSASVPSKKTTRTSHENAPPESRSPNEGEEYFALLAGATNDAVRVWNVKTGELFWPQGLDSLLGYDGVQRSGRINFWQQHIHPDDRTRVTTSLRDALNSGATTWSADYRFRRADGSYLDLLERAAITRDAHGKARQLVGSLMDITHRKQLHDQLTRSQKLEAFGQLAGGMAHDFNNFLTTILGYSDLLLTELGVRGALADHVGEIRSAAGRASVLTAQLVSISRKHALDPRVIEVNTFLTHLERSILRLIGENIRISCEFQRAAAHIRVDPTEMTQVILNLVVNARDAMPKGGELTLETETVSLTADESAPSGEYVSIAVCDTGCGMSDEVKEHLFEPFFTTKEAAGTGLGLATTYAIIRQSGGRIAVESKVGRGTNVTIYLPKVPAPVPLSNRRASRKPVGGNETVLVVEDDVSVRHMSVRVMRSLGYDVIEAASGDDAQRLVDSRRERKIDLLLTDVMMPQMSGRDFAAWLEKTSPETKVLFISGYLDESLRFAEHCDHEVYFLPKPFDSEQLARKVRDALDS
jgi:PAS domain S-box-containing protein